ncbi:hybrid sensor histidine kinase/response regulator [Arenibacterium sp. CAU 1754]
MDLINPNDSIERQNEKLLQIVQALMRRAEQITEPSSLAYAQFERAAMLEAQVHERTADLERTLDLLNLSNQRLAEANAETEQAWANLTEATETIHDGLALFDRDDRLVFFNSMFGSELPDVQRRLKSGLKFSAFIDIVSQSQFLDLSRFPSREAWIVWRMQQHRRDQVVFNLTVGDGRQLQVSSHRTPADNTVIMHTDITDIVRLERLERDKLMDQQAMLLRATLNHLDQGVCIFDREGKLVGWNRRLDTLLALPADHNSRGLNVSALMERLSGQIEIIGHFSFAAFQAWADQKSGRSPIAFEVRRGARSVLSVFGQEMPDQGFVLSFTDVTAERENANALFEMNEQLERRVEERTIELGQALTEAERANASKTRFVAAASHDLLQPLSAAKLFVSSLIEGEIDPSQVQDVARKAETSLQSVEQIIEALLHISRLDSRIATFDRRPVPLQPLLETLKTELDPEARAKGLTFDVVPSSLVVHSDPGYLRRILQNLIVNALRYTDQGKVLIGVRRVNGAARIEVWDTGQGMSENDQKVVFDEFRRLEQGRNAAEGLGLGLAIVERACAALDHPLRLRSKPGVGSCFSVEVPVLDRYHAGVRDSARGVDGKATEACAGVVVLLVENDPQLSNALSMLIEGWGGIVLAVDSATEALALLEDVDIVPEAMLLDYHLDNGQTGIEVYEAVKERHGALPTRIITANRSSDLRRQCAEHKLMILSKPIDRARLLAFLSAVGTAKSADEDGSRSASANNG